MVRNTVPANADERTAANSERFRASELLSNTLIDGTFVPILEAQSDRTTLYAAGFGSQSRNQGNTGFADLDVQNGGGSASDGKLRWEVYRDSSKQDLVAVSSTFRSEDLRSAVTSDRTEKEILPQQAPAAPQDGYLVLAMDADSGSDGDTVNSGNSDSDLGVPYARIQ